MEVLYADLFEAAGAGRQQGEQMAALAGQTQSRWQTLWVAESGEFTVPQIARRLGVTRQNVQRVVADLASHGLVVLAQNPDHKTSPLVRLTDSGRRALTTINDVADETHKRMQETFTNDDVEALRSLLQRFTAAVRSAAVLSE